MWRNRIGTAAAKRRAPGRASSRTCAARDDTASETAIPRPSLVRALPTMAAAMRSRLFLRRSAAAAGIYSSAVLGFLATVVAAHRFSTTTFGLYALVIAATGFFQSLLDLTVEEALVKYGFRYAAREEWGRLRGLFRAALLFKLTGAALAAGTLLALAPLADDVLHKGGLATPLAIAALLPLAQFAEGTAGVAP